MDSPLALYRRYRPETFSQVIGQDHVTEPLRNALAADRVNHAYLFSGPRGCGKTTSARILARTLNCAQAPVAEPCGECDSCRELATGGSGSIDVIEIDAASHGGVDDARDLREKAFFAPVRDRYKIYIIDEAHMVSNQGFNALLKLVEEPPPHLRFIFATTEPEKVIATIRSRTHHYPFRLIPPRMLSDYVAELCQREGVAIEPAALPLVVRAGAGSARDTLSVLDQLIGGSGPDGVTHQLAVNLLGFTPDTLLDEVVDAFAASDGAAVFGVIDKVIESGQDPRRFAEDLLRRLRDLVIVAAVPDAPVTGLIDVSQDHGERLVAQAARFGSADLSRAADLVAAGLMDMKGAISPRLLLELICARVLLPGADHTTEGVQARIDRLEKRFAIVGPGSPSSALSAQPVPTAPVSPPLQPPAPHTPLAQAAPPTSAPPTSAPPTSAPPTSAPPTSAPPTSAPPTSAPPAPAASHAPSGQASDAPTTPPGAPAGGLSLVDVRRLWPEIVDAVKTRRRLAWILLTQNAQVKGVDDRTLTLGFNNPGARDSFVSGGNDEILRQAAIDAVGVDWRVECVVDPGAVPPGSPAASHTVTAPAAAPESRLDPREQHEPGRPPESAPGDGPAAGAAAPEQAAPVDPQGLEKARGAIQQTRTGGPVTPGVDERALADAAAHPDDPDADSQGLDSAELLRRTLGAEMIEEIEHR
ncbi:DNA polymerase III subunit gamma and tau [Nocardioides campestrisoli]|uniref:DNA polymerase III subunit gamma and tau n=1 Tax=Nocardioides campestrisoli TaxID=2736757 RepID=UPI00163D8BB9|nr:DNA polymerase III subunit gamma and tau [Nocardioides campestrisoli]